MPETLSRVPVLSLPVPLKSLVLQSQENKDSIEERKERKPLAILRPVPRQFF